MKTRPGFPRFDAASFLVRKDGVIPKDFDSAIKERAVPMVLDQIPEYALLSQVHTVVGVSQGKGK